MDDLARWLGEQLNHDEAHARKDLWAAEKATSGRWRARYGVNLDHSWVETESTPVLRLDAARHEADALLVARFQPETIKKRAEATLADLDAKRGIVRAYETAVAAFNDTGPAMANYDRLTGSVSALRGSLELLAAVYAERTGYRAEWAPTE